MWQASIPPHQCAFLSMHDFTEPERKVRQAKGRIESTVEKQWARHTARVKQLVSVYLSTLSVRD